MSDEAHRSAVTAPGYSSASDLQPGFAVGEYRIEAVAGRGGMGVVYLAVQPVIEKKVAIKVLNAQLSSDRDLVRRFVDEARAVNRIGHENIIDIFSFGQLPDGRQYFVMEYLEGATLAARLARGDLTSADYPFIIMQVCEALEAAHAKKIVHRDLKPENIWISPSSRGRPRVRLLDFGIAKLLETGERTVTDIGAVMGTPHYMSPEQCNGRGVDHRTDIYAMGVLMYRMFAGRLPIQGQTYAEILAKQIVETPPPPSTIASLPPALDQLIVSCLSKDPAARPQSAGELAAALGTIFGVPTLGGSGPVSMANASQATVMVSAVKAPAVAALGATAPVNAPPADSLSAVAGLPPRKAMTTRAIIALAVVAVGGAAAWLALRPSRSSAPPSPVAASPAVSAPEKPAGPAMVPAPQPVPAPVVAAPPVPPPAVPSPAAVKSPATRDNARPARAARREATPREEAAPRPKKAHERANDTGLVTDNPFQ